MGPSAPDFTALLDRLGPLLWHAGTGVAVLSLLSEIPDVHPGTAAKYLTSALLGAIAGLYYAMMQADVPWLPAVCYGLGAVLPFALRGAAGRGVANGLGVVALIAGWLTMPR